MKNNRLKIIAIQYSIALALALFIGCILIYVQGESPVEAMGYIIDGAIGSKHSFASTLRWATPCLFTGAAVIIAFKSGIMNCGIQGQVYIAALIVAIIGYAVPMPRGIHATVCIIVAGISGMIAALIPALMKLYFQVDELISTLMLNFIITYLTEYIVIWKVIGGEVDMTASMANTTPQILDTAKIPILIKGSSTSYGFYGGILLLILIWIVYKYTRIGYEMKQVGENINYSKVGGINVSRVFLGVFLVSGLIAGLCGGVEVTGSYGRFNMNFSSNIGWDGIMVARIAANNPIAAIAVSIIWGALKAGAMHMERMTSLNRITVNIIQMLFVLFVAVDYETLLNKWTASRQRKKIREKEVKSC